MLGQRHARINSATYNVTHEPRTVCKPTMIEDEAVLEDEDGTVAYSQRKLDRCAESGGIHVHEPVVAVQVELYMIVRCKLWEVSSKVRDSLFFEV